MKAVVIYDTYHGNTKIVAEAIAEWRKTLELKPTFTPAQQMLERYSAKAPAPSRDLILPADAAGAPMQ